MQIFSYSYLIFKIQASIFKHEKCKIYSSNNTKVH